MIKKLSNIYGAPGTAVIDYPNLHPNRNRDHDIITPVMRLESFS